MVALNLPRITLDDHVSDVTLERHAEARTTLTVSILDAIYYTVAEGSSRILRCSGSTVDYLKP